MKILHVLAQMPAKTGSGVYYSNVIAGLAGRGQEQGALFACQDCNDFTLLPASAQYPVTFKCEALPFPVAGMSDEMPYESTIYGEMDEDMIACWLEAFRGALVRAREEFCPDVVLAHHLWMLTSLAVEVMEGVPVAGVCHNTDLRQARQHPRLLHRYAANIKRLDAVFALSDAQRGEIEAVYEVPPERIVTVGGGFDGSLFFPRRAPAVPHDDVTLIYAAKIAPSKGIYQLIEAFSRARREMPGLTLEIVGSPDAENAARLEAALRGREGILRRPALPQGQLAALLREKDVFVMPSFFEGIALGAVEGLASGLWAVTTRIEPLMALLGGEVNASGVIEYIPLPRLYDTDKPLEEDLDAFVDALTRALLTQADKARRGESFPPGVAASLSSHSWEGVAARIEAQLQRLV